MKDLRSYAARARSQKLLGLFEKLYEDNVEGKITDEWFMRLSQKYENEQQELKRQTLELKEKLDIPGIIHRPPYILDSRKGVAIEYLSNAV